MKLKPVLYLVVSLILTAGIALAQQPSPSTPQTAGEPVRQFSLLVDGGSFLGVYAENINKENVNQYGLREAQGVGVTEVIKDSPAEKAGLKKGDVILRFENEAVTSVRKLNRLVAEVAPDHTVTLSISRGGAEQALSVTLGTRNNYSFESMPEFQGLESMPDLQKMEGLRGLWKGQNGWKWEMPESGKDGLVYAFGNNRRIGVSTTTLTKQLADFFGVTDGKGVLVTAVDPDSPAGKAGIKAGDVITAVDGQKIEGAGDLARGINKQKDGDVTLTIVRDKTPRSFKVTPKQSSGALIQPGTPQAGMRRIVIPEINLPSIPAVNVALPQIDLPVIPEINVVIPNVPKVKIIRAPSQRRPI
jgi:membrane-associated protease RseP (regulator of RpoE activity)